MPSNPNVRAEFTLLKDCHYPGDVVQGCLILHAKLDTAIKGIGIRFVGVETAHFSEGGEVHSDSQNFIDFKITLYGNPQSTDGPDLLLKQGSWRYPFALPLDYGLPPSIQLGSVTSIQYRAELLVTFAAFPRLRAMQPFRVAAVGFVGDDDVTEVVSRESFPVMQWGCWRKGFWDVICTLMHHPIRVLGQQTSVHVQVNLRNHTTSAIKRVGIYLRSIRSLQARLRDKPPRRFVSVICETEDPVSIPPGETGECDLQLSLPEPLEPSARAGLIQVEYEVVVYCGASKAIVSCLPVVLVHAVLPKHESAEFDTWGQPLALRTSRKRCYFYSPPDSLEYIPFAPVDPPSGVKILRYPVQS